MALSKQLRLALVLLFVSAWLVWFGAARVSRASVERQRAPANAPNNTQSNNPACQFPLPLPSIVGVARFEQLLDDFLAKGCYLNWMHDREIRSTGPFIDQSSDPKQRSNFGIHPAVKVYYSPEVWQWLINGRRDDLPDGALIVKEQYPLPVKQNYTAKDRTGWSVMARDSQGSWDGWYWSAGVGLGTPSPYVWPFIYPWAGFGQYCVNCHASTDRTLSTYATLRNITGDPLTYLTVVPTMDPRTIDLPNIHLRLVRQATGMVAAAPNATPTPLPQPSPDPAFVQLFNAIKPSDVPQPQSLPGESYDSVPQGPRPNGQKLFLTSDQCIGCHDGTQSNAALPNMIYTVNRGQQSQQLNLSPYGEWRASMMGLAGRDPIFYAQLETERALFPQFAAQIDNTCLSCHGVMGQRQLAHNTNNQVPFTHNLVLATPDNDPANANYGALARDGVSCTVCHHISAEGLGTPATYTGKFKIGQDNDIYGPYQEVVPLPMQNALGLTPRKTQQNQIQSSALCGSCHTVEPPVLSDGGADQPDPFKNPKKISHEQTTYFEWRNSIYTDEGRRTPQSKSCQECHMPNEYAKQPLKFRIANIEDNTFPFVDNRAPDKEITLRTRGAGTPDRYSRHTLVGINLFGLKIFEQYPDSLGIRPKDPMATFGTPLSGAQLAQAAAVELATKESAELEITQLTRSGTDLEAHIKIVNLAGHKFPSGVGFRRAFLELLVLDAQGNKLWASGSTDKLGVVVDGRTGRQLETEFFTRNAAGQQTWQPYYSIDNPITRQDQVQIYEELYKDKVVDGVFTTSFLSLAHEVKDTRLMPKGWSLSGPDADTNKPNGGEGKPAGKGYYDGSGSDEVVYKIGLGKLAAKAARVTATLYYQSIPPYYLQQRFTTASTGTATRNLWYYASRLNVNAANSPIASWKLKIVGKEKPLAGNGKK